MCFQVWAERLVQTELSRNATDGSRSKSQITTDYSRKLITQQLASPSFNQPNTTTAKSSTVQEDKSPATLISTHTSTLQITSPDFQQSFLSSSKFPLILGSDLNTLSRRNQCRRSNSLTITMCQLFYMMPSTSPSLLISQPRAKLVSPPTLSHLQLKKSKRLKLNLPRLKQKVR